MEYKFFLFKMAIAIKNVIALTGFLVICVIVSPSIAQNLRATTTIPGVKLFCLYNTSSFTREGKCKEQKFVFFSFVVVICFPINSKKTKEINKVFFYDSI